ncbi:MAG: peptide ABC transporter substrate-binding protein [Clostridia bacterium]|nr:peptide ABC transporter substrate-binding protein [Clostridia bacterium]
MTKKIVSLLLALVFALSLGAAALAAEGDTQVLNLRATAFGNNYDVQDMGWRWMMADCYEGLFRNVATLEDGEQFILAGAESYEVNDEGTVYTFHLRQDAKWSDGVPVTAQDYEYGWKRLVNPEYAYDYASFIYNVVGAEEYSTGTGDADGVMAVALDDYTFQVTLKIPDSTFLSKLVATPLYPTRQEVAEAAGENWGKDWTLCVYNGPFCMSELVEDNRMTWTRNEYYWDAANVGLDAVNWYLVAEDATATIMFDNGELDLLQTSGDYLIKYNQKVQNGEIAVWTTDYPSTYGLFFNFVTGGPDGLVANASIRKALCYAIDRDEMIEAVFGRYVPAYAWVAPAISFDGSSYRSQVVSPFLADAQTYVGDTDTLRALFQKGLEELGRDTDLSSANITLLSYGSTMENQTMREYLQQIWEQALGIKVTLNTVGDYSLFTAERDAGNYDLMVGSWSSDYNDPLDFLDTFHSNRYASYGKYNNPAFDALIDSLNGENDNAKRLAIYTEAEQLLADDCALIPIYHMTRDYFMQNWVKNFRTSSFGASQELYITYIDGRGN